MHKARARIRGSVGAVLALAMGCSSEEVSDERERTPEQVVAARQALLAASDDHDFDSPPDTAKDDCDVTLKPAGSDDADALIEVLEELDSYSTVCLAPGEYGMNRSVVISSASSLTIKGIGDGPQDTVLDFAGHAGDKGFDVTTPGFWIENLHIKNTSGNGVEVKADNEADNPAVFRKLKVTWDLPEDAPMDCSDDDPRPQNGAYSVYPTLSSYVVVEFCEVQGASDAGLYVGSVEHGTVRHNRVRGNVAGLEVENSEDVVVYDNEASGNAGGILALQEPGLKRLNNSRILIRDNMVHNNNGCNFARPNTTVANIPSGTGLMSFAGSEIEFRDNDVYENETAGLLIVSNVMQDLITGDEPDYPEGYDPFSHHIYVNGNRFNDNATAPASTSEAIAALVGGFKDVVWDGFVLPGVEDTSEAEICLGEDPPPFVDVSHGQCAQPSSEAEFVQCIATHATNDTDNHTCTGEVDAEGA